jgi:rubrerythrin
MAELKGSLTEQCLKDAFAWEAQANRRYLYFAKRAEAEGRPEVAALFRSTAEGESGHANGHLEFLERVGDPVTGMPMGNLREMLASVVASETRESSEMYPRMARVARDEGFDDVADWFEVLAKAESNHATRYTHALTKLSE